MSFFISDALAQAQTPGAMAGGWEGLLFPLGLILILYFFMIRPQMKRQKEHKTMVESLSKGDEVAIEGGLIGRITDLGENFAQIEVTEGVNVKVRKQAVAAVLPKGSIKGL